MSAQELNRRLCEMRIQYWQSGQYMLYAEFARQGFAKSRTHKRVLKHDLWCKMRFFGRAIEAQEESDESTQSRGPQNLLDLLPEIFTREEASAMRQRIGIRNVSLSQMLNNWKQRRYIEVYGEEMKRSEVNRQRYIKTEEYLQKHPQRDVTQYSVFG